MGYMVTHPSQIPHLAQLPQTPQLIMTWPSEQRHMPAQPQLPPGYRLRTYQPGDEERFFEVMTLSGWTGWDEATLKPWIARIVPNSWWMVVWQPDDASLEEELIVASAMGLHDHTDWHPFGGELGWVASDPAHRGRRLGQAVCAAVTARLIQAGYQNIHLYTEDYRLSAIRTYLRLGYTPYSPLPEMAQQWHELHLALAQAYDGKLNTFTGGEKQHE